MIIFALSYLAPPLLPTPTLQFNVVYHDTHAYERHAGPIVLVLHGLQLPAANFTPLIDPLIEQGCRVIAPIFPLIGHNFFKVGRGLRCNHTAGTLRERYEGLTRCIKR